MELKKYQKIVMEDLSSFLSFVNTDNNIITAWKDYWASKDIKVGPGGVSYYNNAIVSVPHVCMKVPTGGGKTFMACAALKRIFSFLPSDKPKVVVWLVPSDSILLQTVNNLSNPQHPYRERINMDFSNRVEVFTKEQLLTGQNFSPDTVRESLSVCILGYASVRINKLSKEERKVYQENGNLKRFADYFKNQELILSETPETALMQVLAQLSPVVIVDESHNAQSSLSIEMLNNLNPSFVLDLTATPRTNSNIISYVDARELKRENMVKLPVVVFNRNTRSLVIQDAIQLRGCLEQLAKQEDTEKGRAIRPIVLFQAQPKTSDDNTTFEIIKKLLLDMGIPEDQIGIKTSKVDTISKLDLMNPECQIRYIITVNALKEGWDCPYAYILASLANKSSKVDVEQILGRILRQPNAVKNKSQHLNTSYVLTSSSDFYATLDNIVKGLNNAGFTDKDYRVSEDSFETPVQEPCQPDLPEKSIPEQDNFADIVPSAITISTEGDRISNAYSMLEKAANQANAYESDINNTDTMFEEAGGLRAMLNTLTVQDQFKDNVKDLKLPQFMLRSDGGTIFSFESLLSPENLSEGLSLKDQDTNINFQLATGDMYNVDLSDSGDAIPKYRKTDFQISEQIRKYVATIPSADKVKECTNWICNQLNKRDSVRTEEINDYVKRVISNLSNEEIEIMETSVASYAKKIEQKIESIELRYREKKFKEWLDTGKISCKENYSFPEFITPSESISSIPKSLYNAESNTMNNYERRVINEVVSLENIVWWHRIIDRKGFVINGFINHYPDFVVKTQKGKIVLIETKADFLDGSDSRQKIYLGRKWMFMAGDEYRYFMVFEHKDINEDGAYTLDDFIPILKNL